MNIEKLKKIKDQFRPKLENRLDSRPLEKNDNRKISIMVCRGSGCIASAGKTNPYEAFVKALEKYNLKEKVEVVRTGCHGLCEKGPIAVIHPGATLYTNLQTSDVEEIVQKHVIKKEFVERLLYWDTVKKKHISSMNNISFYNKQTRRILCNNGLIDPMIIEEYIATDGYFALAKTLEMDRLAVIEEVKKSELKGRGGAGFPTGLKWEFAYKAKGDQKYMVCNADEGDPGAYMNRSELEGNPHAVLEGMVIGAYAIGATKGYIYVRAEYPLAIETLENAIVQAREHGLLGKNILGTSFNFDIEIFLGSGAFVCGEETALLASIEQKRGNPRPKPPFPANEGLFGKPTILNNVGTLCNIPLIMQKGADWWSGIGTESAKGTKVFSLTGNINNSGLIEVPMGISLGEIVFDIGGGVPNGKKFKAAQLGGPSGGCVPAQYLNLPIDYESLKGIGCIMGSGALVVLDEDTCMVDTAKFFLEFDRDESCGQCLPCRRGLPLMVDILAGITEGRGKLEDLDTLQNLAEGVAKTSLCALGQTAASPTLSTIQHFRDEYEAHIIDKKCPAGVCAVFFKTKCQNACPINQDIPTYLALAKEDQMEESYKVIKQTNPIPRVLGRVCHHPCEYKCERQKLDEALSVRHVKRFVADFAYENNFEYRPPQKPEKPEKVAIVGSGPAGLSAAYDLAIEGYKTTIFEGLPTAGGMLAVGIPEYRLPRNVLNYDIEQIKKMGAEIKLNTKIDNIDKLLDDGFKAVFLAIGAHGERKMNIPGEDLKGVCLGMDFLKNLNLGEKVEIGKKVVVIGGGNSAMDCARVVKRLGADSVTVVYRREEKDMPAIKEEIEAAQKEGITFECLSLPVEIIGNDCVEKVKCERMTFDNFDASCRKITCPIKGSEYTIDADMVIESIGQFPQSSWLAESKVEIAENKRIIADKRTLATGREGIFAGGDAFSGPRTVCEAVAEGQRAAFSINQYLQKLPLSEVMNRQNPEKYLVPFASDEEPQEKARVAITEKDPGTACKCFDEIACNYSKQEALEEAGRCLRCDAWES